MKINGLLALGLILGLTGAAAVSSPLSFDKARATLYERSDILKASDANLESKKQEEEALKSLGQPTISVQAMQIAGQKKIKLQKDFQKTLDLPMIGPLPLNLPISIEEKYSLNGPRASATAIWPIYTGGKIEAAKMASKYGVDEAYAQKRASAQELDAQLAGLYFGYQLALSVQKLQKTMLNQQDQELKRAIKFEKQGMISKIERMSVEVSRDNAKRDYLKARDSALIAKTELQRLLRDPEFTTLTTPLFVLKSGLQPLTYWQDIAVRSNPQISIIDAKHGMARQGVKAAEADWKPQVFAFGNYAFIKHYQSLVEPNWIGGIGINYTIWSERDRKASVRSAEAKVREAEAGRAEAVNQVKTGVEVAWLNTKTAIDRYKLSASTVKLATQNLKLKSKAFGEGLATALDVTEARNQLLKAEVGRRLAAFEFVTSYAVLHAICGKMDEFPDALRSKNVYIEN